MLIPLPHLHHHLPNPTPIRKNIHPSPTTPKRHSPPTSRRHKTRLPRRNPNLLLPNHHLHPPLHHINRMMRLLKPQHLPAQPLPHLRPLHIPNTEPPRSLLSPCHRPHHPPAHRPLLARPVAQKV